jgi:hypothetical protein
LSATSASKIASTICPRARKTAHQQILFHRERREQRARLRHLQQAGADDLARRAPGDLRAVEMDAAIDNLPVFLLEHAGDRLQNGRFAGAIGTEQRHDRAGRHIERHIAHGLDRAIVKNLHVFQRQHGIIRGRLCENDERRADESHSKACFPQERAGDSKSLANPRCTPHKHMMKSGTRGHREAPICYPWATRNRR